MRIGITGASGLVGRALTKLAVAEGHEVVAFSRSPESKIDAACETRDFQVPDNARVDDLDAMVHLAGEPILGWWSQSKRDRIRESRVSGTAGVVEAIRRCAENRRPEVLVCASGSGYYGDRGDEVLDEDADSGFGFLARVCREWEAAASRVNDHGVRWVSARTGMVLGREGGAAPLLEKLFKFCLGGRLGALARLGRHGPDVFALRRKSVNPRTGEFCRPASGNQCRVHPGDRRTSQSTGRGSGAGAVAASGVARHVGHVAVQSAPRSTATAPAEIRVAGSRSGRRHPPGDGWHREKMTAAPIT